MKPQRFNNVGLGTDIKCTARAIKLTPGAGDYDPLPANSNAVVIKTHNYCLNNGGVAKPFLKQNPKEHLIENSFTLDKRSQSLNRAVDRKRSALSRKSGQGYGKEPGAAKLLHNNII